MKHIKLPNGSTAVSFVPEDSKDLAIVHIATIKRLAGLLQLAHYSDIRLELIEKMNSVGALPKLVEVTEEFTNFHKTINLIQEYKPVEPKVVGYVNLDE